MILNVSGRCDIVAFYTDWFLKRYREGFVDVRNPFYPKQVSRIYFEDVDLIVFCTKTPKPIVPYLKEIHKPILFQVTLTPYKRDVEPNVIKKEEIIESIKQISNELGREFVSVRYDPIFISKKYSLSYHLKAFERICSLLDGYVKQIIVSFIDEYKNSKKNWEMLGILPFTDSDYETIGKEFSRIAKNHGMTVQTCFEKNNLVKYGFVEGECVSRLQAYQLTGKKFPAWKARGCGCAAMVDIGVYNSCKHFCKYCYANFDEEQVLSSMSHHENDSSLLVGHLESDDVIKVRRK